MVRLWVNGEDYGTMPDKMAETYRDIHVVTYPNEPIRLEPVPDDTPTFLTPADE